MNRRIPRVADLLPLVRFQRPALSLRDRLANAHTIEDLRLLAKRRTPRGPFNYADGAADEEISLRRARDAFADVVFHPSVLRDVAEVDASTTVLGKPVSMPFGIAPTGFTRLMHTEGELGGVTAAAEAGIPFTLSTMGTAAIEDVARRAMSVSSSSRTWFQLYVWKDRGRSTELIQRAAAAGMEALVVTVDVPVGGRRLRDLRSGMTVPPALTPKTFLEMIPHPAWWFDVLTTEPLAFASLDHSTGSIRALFESMFDPSVTLDDLDWIRETWSGPVVVKGIQTEADAVRVAEAGADAIVLSTHGGRQLDRAPAPLDLLPAVASTLRDRSNRTEIWLDTGISSGADILAARAMGANFTLIGRAYLYGLMAGGRLGVARAIEILRTEMERTMRLLGVRDLSELSPAHVSHIRSAAGTREGGRLLGDRIETRRAHGRAEATRDS
ncbi:alpha-hydroxy-acid oxidizing protein [Microbacterium trichothecenolyticum]|uniref:alpha-hydroxy acid oxidase n=1 Tax=Microbacterium trichothecenolyticum TaxID=69370 RepID=UPI0035BEA1FB